MRFVWDNLKNESQIVSPCATQSLDCWAGNRSSFGHIQRENQQYISNSCLFQAVTNNQLVL